MMKLETGQTFQKKVYFINLAMIYGLIVVLGTERKVTLWKKLDFQSI